MRDELKVWYDGYKFHQNGELVYNPFSVMNVLKKKEFRRYWFATGTPTFLMKLLEKNLLAFFNDNNAQFYAEDLCLLDPARINFPVLLFQTGYLTLNQFDAEEKTYTLKFPNLEVKSAYNGLIATEIIGRKSEDSSKKKLAFLRQHITNDDHKEIFNLLKIMCANIPYTIQNPVKQWGTKASETQTHAEQEAIQKEMSQKISEQYYQTIFYMIFWLSGVDIKVEDATNIGRIDAVITTKTHHYIFELKLDKSAEVALNQIKAMKYYEKFLGTGKKITLVGIKFDSTHRTVTEYLPEELAE